MSAKTKKHDEKMKRKRAVKAARKAEYTALAGTSKKSKRATKKSVAASSLRGAHAMAACGNSGCKQCNPQFAVATHGAILGR